MKMKRIWPPSWPLTPWVVLAFWGLVTAAFTWPLIINLGNTLPDWADGADSAWRLGSIAHQLQTDPLHLYNTLAFYPLHNALALDELLTGQGLLAAPVIWLTSNPPLAYNLLVFTSFTLSGFSMWLLVRYLTGSSGAGLVAGLIFAFSPWHYGQFAHLGLGAQHWMIFALYFLIRFTQETDLAKPSGEEMASARKVLTLKGLLQRKKFKFLGLFVIFFAFQAITAGYYAYYEAILVGFYLTYYFIWETGLIHRLWGKIFKKNQPVNYPFTGWNNILSQIILLFGAGIVILVIIIPFVFPFLQTQAQYDFKRDLTETSYWSGSPNSLLRTVDRSWLYNPVQRGLFNLQTSPERMLYPGLIAALLALVSLFSTFSRKGFDNNEPASKHRLAWLFMLLSLSGLVLSFGPELNLEGYGLEPTGITLPYKWFYEYIPGFDALRVPLRFGQLFMLGIAVCAGYGTAWLSNNYKLMNLQTKIWHLCLRIRKVKPSNSNNLNIKKGLIITFLIVLVGVDYFAPGLPNQLTNTGKAAPPLYNWLAGEEAALIIPGNALLLEVPVGEGRTPVNANPIYLMYGLSHGRPMLNGSSNIFPPGYDRLYYELQSFPAPATLDIIEGLGVKFVVVHTRGLAADANRAELEKQARPGGRLEMVQSFADPTDSRFKEAVYRVKPAPQRFQPLAALIPAGSSVLLADTNSHRKLYTYTLAALIGPNRRYFAPFSTVYNGMVGGVQLAQPGQVFDYALFYRSGGPNPADYGFTPSDLIPLPAGDFDTISLYHKK